MKNRFALAPMTNHQCAEDGSVTDGEVKWLSMRAEGGFGLVMTCAAHVSKIGQGFPGQLGVFSDDLLPGMKRLADSLKDTFSVVQLHHAGIRSPHEVIGERSVGPSDHEETDSRAMSYAEVKAVIQDFIDAAVRSQDAGFDGVEIHGAHSYLLTQFMSTELNHRDDEYGGSYENRTRIVREIIAGVKSACKSGFSIGLRLSPEGNGMSLTEVTKFCQEMIDQGDIDYLDISLWDCFKEPEDEKYQGRTLLSYFTELDRKDVKLGVAGKLYQPQDCDAMMEHGVDFVMLGRAAILHHDFPNRYQEDSKFTATRAPVSAAYLKQEGLSEAFVNYMSGWVGFVE